MSHTADEIVSLLNELEVYDRLDAIATDKGAIATDNGATFVEAVEELLETGICEEHMCFACTHCSCPSRIALIQQSLRMPQQILHVTWFQPW